MKIISKIKEGVIYEGIINYGFDIYYSHNWSRGIFSTEKKFCLILTVFGIGLDIRNEYIKIFWYNPLKK